MKIRIKKPAPAGGHSGRRSTDSQDGLKREGPGPPWWATQAQGGDAAPPPPGAGLKLFRAFTAQGHGLSPGGPAKEYFGGDDYRLATIINYNWILFRKLRERK